MQIAEKQIQTWFPEYAVVMKFVYHDYDRGFFIGKYIKFSISARAF